MFVSLFVFIAGLCYCSTGSCQSLLGHPRLSGPSEALLKTIVELQCELLSYPKNESVLLLLYKKGNHTKLLSEYTLQEDVGTFNLVIKPFHDGNLECLATLQNNTKAIEATVSNTHYLKVIEPVEGAELEVLSGPLEFFEGNTLKLSCKLKAGSYVSYKWLLNDQLIPQSPFHIQFDNKLWIYRTISKDSGSYRCVASNEFNNTFFTSNTSAVHITVKDLVSNPDISFVVLKEDFHNYFAEVTCQSTRGTPPITFSLYNRELQPIHNMTSEDRKAAFMVPLELNKHMGWFQCQADNGNWTAHSQWLSLEVVSVGGPVEIYHEYDTGENYAVVHLVFYCKVAKGSHPQYKWFLNDTLLRDHGNFYRVVNQLPGQSTLQLAVEMGSAGTYHCEVSDSFDNITGISSKKQYMDKEVLNHLPVLVVAVIFGCFTILILLVCVCCWIGVLFRRRQFGENSLLGLEMKKTVIVYEGELDLLDSSEDDDLGKTTSRDEFDKASEPSVNEWLQIIEEKKTLEDGPIEFP